MGKARPERPRITVRKGRASDRPHILRWMRQLAEETGAGRIGEGEAEGVDLGGLFIANVGGKPAGFIQLRGTPEGFTYPGGSVTGHPIELAYTDPAHREGGVFTALDARLEKHARRHPGVERLISWPTHPHVVKARREGGWTELRAPRFRRRKGKVECLEEGLFVMDVR